MKRLSFKEYYESKKQLLSACDNVPRIRNEYKLVKYCKFPVFESNDSDEKTYVSFKPKDKIEVLWEKINEADKYPVAKRMVLLTKEGQQEVYPCWHNQKLHKWIENNTVEV